MKKRLKDTEIKYRIKLDVIQKHFKEGNCYHNEPYLLCVKIDKGYMSTSTCFKYTKKGKKELLKFIEKECYLP